MPSQNSPAHTLIDTRYQAILLIAIPVMFANIAVPIQSMIDTAIVGNMGQSAYISALGLSAQIIMLILGSVNFLSTSTNGLSAQALGKINAHNDIAYHRGTPKHRKQLEELLLVLMRSVLIAFGLALVFMLCQGWLIAGLIHFFDASTATNNATESYLAIRFWGFPAELANYALFGWFAGLGKTRILLVQQLIISISNVLLSMLFVYGLGMTLDGVAIGTVIAQYLGMAFALLYVQQHMHFLMGNKHTLSPSDLIQKSFNLPKIKALFSLNGNVFIRSMLLTFSFAWITKLATMQGEDFLASNVILLYLLTISAFALDGIAVSAKTMVGQAYGSMADKTQTASDTLFKTVLKNTGVVNIILAIGLCCLWLLLFPLFLDMMTNIDRIKTLASDYKWYACFLPLAGAVAYWLDGVFYGLTDGTSIRNGMVIVAVVFFPVSYWFSLAYGNVGVWLGIYLFLLARACVLSVFLWMGYLRKG